MVNFKLASAALRGLATILDIMLMFFLSLLLVMVPFIPVAIKTGIIWFMVTFYHLICEILLDGASIGKKLVGIKVVTIDGTSPSIKAIYLRWVFRAIDIMGSLGCLAIMSIVSTKYSQRIGDQVAQTVVVVRKEDRITLEALLEIGNTKREIVYPQVTLFTDEDMMILKNVMNRSTRYPNNDKLRKLKRDLAKDIAERLRVPTANITVTNFLDQVLHDYVILTR